MNIFASHPNPYRSATALDNKRTVKMVLETCQLLCTAINISGGASPYKSTHVNHPCSIWARETRSNYLWLLEHFIGLCREYTLRYGKTHKCESYLEMLAEGTKLIPEGEMTKHPNCTTFKQIDNVFVAYQMYLNEKWNNDKLKPKWTYKEHD